MTNGYGGFSCPHCGKTLSIAVESDLAHFHISGQCLSNPSYVKEQIKSALAYPSTPDGARIHLNRATSALDAEPMMVEESVALYWKKQYRERVDQSQDLHMEYREFQDLIAKSLGINIGRLDSWIDLSMTMKKDKLLDRIARLKQEKKNANK